MQILGAKGFQYRLTTILFNLAKPTSLLGVSYSFRPTRVKCCWKIVKILDPHKYFCSVANTCTHFEFGMRQLRWPRAIFMEHKASNTITVVFNVSSLSDKLIPASLLIGDFYRPPNVIVLWPLYRNVQHNITSNIE